MKGVIRLANYASIINTIRSAIYGRDMREAIAQGFELCSENGGGGAVNIDKTLTLPDYAADAKVVGDKFTELESTIASIEPVLNERSDSFGQLCFNNQYYSKRHLWSRHERSYCSRL